MKIKFTNWRIASSSLHRVIGVWALLFNMLIFLSSIYIQKKFFVSKWWDKYTQSSNANEKHVHKITYPLSSVSLDSPAIIAHKMVPYIRFQGFSIDCGGGGGIAAFGIKQESLFQAYDNIVTVNFDSSGKYISTD